MSAPPAAPASRAPAPCPSCAARGDVVFDGLRDRHFASDCVAHDSREQVAATRRSGVDEARTHDAEACWSVRRCEACDLHWLDPQPDASRLAGYYRDYYTHDVGADEGFESQLKRALAAVTLGYDDAVGGGARLATRALACFGPLRAIGESAGMWLTASERGRLLDVGCGAGDLLARMQSLGWRVEGVEPDEAGARSARARLAGVAVHTDLSCGPAPGSFDAVTLAHVFEHLADPQAVLRGCFEALRPGGRLVIATPNPASSGCARFGRHWLHWDPPRHLRLYGRRSLVAQLESAGFSPRRVFSSAASAHFAHAASWLIERDGVLPGIDVAALPVRARAAGLGFWVREYLAARRRDCGEEWVAIAEKPAP